MRVAREAQQRGRHRTRRQNPVDHARGDGAARHRGVLGRGRILRQHGPHLLLHGLDADGGVASGTGQDDGDGALALILGQGPEEHIDRPVKARWLATRGRIQHTAADGEGSVGGNHEDAAGNDPRRLGDLDRWQGGVGRQNGGHVAGGRGVQVQDDDERHPDVRRHSIEELAERPNPACGRPDGDDRKSVAGAAYRWPSFLRHRLPRPLLLATRDTVEVTLEQRVLRIHGGAEVPLPEGLAPLYLEYQPGDYERAFTLSDAVDPAGIEARVRAGVLHLKLPKAGPAKQQRIEVRAD